MATCCKRANSDFTFNPLLTTIGSGGFKLMKKINHDLIILGSGPAGCTAAIYTARANLDFALITGFEQGGQITKTSNIANWPGEPNEISGAILMEKMMQQVAKFTDNIFQDEITQANLSVYPFSLKSDNHEYFCKSLIIATGASPRFLGVAKEQEYLGRGVSTCAVCDGFFYKGKDVAIVGGGNTMAEEALYLAKMARSVTIIHRRDSFRAEEWLVEQLKKTPNVKFELVSVIEDIIGNASGVAGLVLKNLTTNSVKEIAIDGLFIAVGHIPNSKIFANQLELEEDFIKTGYLLASQCSVAGVFAAGDVVFNHHRQAIVAAGSGCTAALDAKNFLGSLIRASAKPKIL